MKRAADSDDASLLSKIRGATDDRMTQHEVTCYRWRGFHEGSATCVEKAFASKRQALLYVAKRNSECLQAHLTESSSDKPWEKLFGAAGSPYALSPNAPFILSSFVDLDDDAIEAYANGVCDAFSRHKVEKGAKYRYAPRKTDVMQEEQLLKVLKRDKPDAEEKEHAKRQAALLSNLAGFD